MLSAVLVGGCFDDGAGGLGGARDDDDDEMGTTGDAIDETGPGDVVDGSSDDGNAADASDGSSGEPQDPTGEVPTGQLRVVHAAAGVGPVDIYVSGSDSPVVQGLSYADASPWLDLEAGAWTFEFRPAGTAADVEPVFVSEEVSLDEDERMTAVAAGLLGSEDPATAFRLQAIVEDWGAPLADRARARLVHAGIDVPTVDIEGVDAESLAPFGSTDPQGFGLETEGGDRIRLFAPDTTNELTSFTTPPLVEGDEVLLIASGRFEALARQPDGLSVVAVGREGALGVVRQDPQLFVLHGSRDAGNLEVCAGDFELAANFDYAEIQSTRVAPGALEVSIHNYPSGCAGEVLNTNATGALEAGGRYLLLVTGETDPEDVGEAGIQVTTFDDSFELDDPGAARLRFVHGASYSQIYVGSVVDDAIVASNVYTAPISWSVESTEVSLMEGFFRLGIADAVGRPEPPYEPIVSFPYDAVGSARQWAIVAGDPSPELEDGGLESGFLQVLVVDTMTPSWSVSVVDVELAGQ